MSAPTPRGQRGGRNATAARGTARGSSTTASPSGRGSFRGGSRGNTANNTASRGRGRGRGATSGAAVTSTGSASGSEGLLQKLRTGALRRGSDNGSTGAGQGRGRGNPTRGTNPSTTKRGRGRGASVPTFSTTFGGSSALQNSAAHATDGFSTQALPTSAPSVSYATFMQDMNAKWQSLKQQRESERAKAIRDGFLADPEKKTSLDKAITPVGTCTDMCPAFERVERIVQNMVDKAEKVPNDASGRDMPSEERMVKRFRRSAAGNDEQLPSDIRTPETLQKTLDYLLDNVIGGSERLASVHKFVWDRTRAIRNDFSIQQVTARDDVRIAIDCYERIARFHILCLHQLSNPDNLLEGENFDAHQEREQLNNTLLSLMYYYDDNRHVLEIGNEPEFRAYCIIFEIQSQHPDLEDRMQSWPGHLLSDRRVQTALKLYTAVGNILFEQGPLRPMVPFSVAQNKSGSFWSLLASKAVPYLMSCVAEIYFAHIRFAALDALWRSVKSAPQAQQAKTQDWTLGEVTNHLYFDTDELTVDFCAAFDLHFNTTADGEQYLDFTALSSLSLDKSSIPKQQVFSHEIVEVKRYRRTFQAVVNGIGVAQAIRDGLVTPEDDAEEDEENDDDAHDEEQSLFVPEKNPTVSSTDIAVPVELASGFGSRLNPQAPSFTSVFGSSSDQPVFSTKFGESAAAQKSIFGQSAPAITNVETTGSQTPMFGGTSQQPIKQDSLQDQGVGLITTPPTAPEPKFSFGTTPFSGFNPQNNTPLLTTQTPSTSTAPSTSFSFGEASQQPPSLAKPSFGGGFNFGQIATPKHENAVLSQDSPDSSLRPSSNQPPPSSQTRKAAPSFGGNLTSIVTTSSFSFSSPAVNSPFTPSANHDGSPSQRNLSFERIDGQSSTEQPAAASVTATSAFTFPSTPSQKSISPLTESKASSNTSVTELTAAKSSQTRSSQPPFSFFKSVDEPVNPQTTQTRPQPTPSQFDSTSNLENPVQTSVPATSAPQSTTPPQSPKAKNQKSIFTNIDKIALVQKVAHLSLCQSNGLLQEYLEYILPGLVKAMIRQHEEEQHQSAIDRLKKFYLFRKYGPLWRNIAWRGNLNRKASRRRQLFAETMRTNQEKKRRDEQELEAIINAANERKRIQAEIKQTEAIQAKEPVPSVPAQLAGTKRKDHSTGSTEQVTTTPAERHIRNHKRSKTVDTTNETQSSMVKNLQSSHAGSFKTSIFSARSLASRPGSSPGPLGPRPHSKQDATQTDYFRLLALGVDPLSPMIPLTAEQVEQKKQKDMEEKERVVSEAWNRRRMIPRPTNSVSPQQTLPNANIESLKSTETEPRSPASSTVDAESEDLLKQLRAAREAMANETQWFKDQAIKMEESEREAQLRFRTANQKSPPRLSINGLPIVNGHEYRPALAKPGVLLSRTEQRIRATGARGLAYKPIGVESNYAPVAMSKRGALRYTQSQQQGHGTTELEGQKQNGMLKRRRSNKGSLEEQESIHPALRNNHHEDVPSSKDASGSARSINTKPATLGHLYSTNPYAHLQQYETADENDDDEIESEETEEMEDEDDFEHENDDSSLTYAEYQKQGHSTRHRHLNGSTAQAADDAELEDEYAAEDEERDDSDDEEDDVIDNENEDDLDIEDEEDEEEEYESNQYLNPHARLLSKLNNYDGDTGEDAGTPGTQISRASSGPGASADDALVLSD